MSASSFSSLRIEVPFRTRAAGLATCLFGALLALAFAGPAQAVDKVDLGDAESYSVLAGFSVTSTGPTAMSESLGVSPESTLAGTPIVLGETHLGDAEAAAAKDSLDAAYADAVLRPSELITAPADFIGRTYTTGVYGTPAAMGFSGGTLTLDAQNDPDAVFIFQIGGALSVAASTTVALVNEAQACNVFWTVGGSTTIGASARFAGTMMADVGITVGANTRVDGRLLADDGAITLDGNAVRTACATPPPVVVGPAGPAGPAGADGVNGIDGVDGIDGTDGTDGTDGASGPQGPSGLTGSTGADGTDGAQGVAGLTGANGLVGATGADGTDGEDGATGPATAPGADGVDGADGLDGIDGATGVQGPTGLTGSSGADGTDGAQGVAGLTGANGLTGATGPVGAAGTDGTDGEDRAIGPAGSRAETTRLCVTNRAHRGTVRRGGVVRWTIVVNNCGERAASGVSVRDRVRKGASLRTRGGGALVRGQLRWRIGTLAPGASKTYKITTRFDKNARIGRYVNRATAEGDNTQPTTGQGSTTVRRAPRP
jgi:uncharacterized repeat protein (TIGR01451 family)